jgi:hypothetical protein
MDLGKDDLLALRERAISVPPYAKRRSPRARRRASADIGHLHLWLATAPEGDWPGGSRKR